MSCPAGFTSLSGENPHLQSQPRPTVFKAQPPQSDGRIPPPLPPRRITSHSNGINETGPITMQGPIPPWATFITAWYHYAWGMGRAILLTGFIFGLIPFLHLFTLIGLTIPTNIHGYGSRLILALFYPILRLLQSLYTGLIVCVFETIGGSRLMWSSGPLSNQFWGQTNTDATTTTTIKTGDSNKSPSTLVTVFISNQTSYTSFMDAIVFFCIAYRRNQKSNLYFLPIDQTEWGLGSTLLHIIFLSPLTIYKSETIDLFFNSVRGSFNFVWFPESTAVDDRITSVPMVNQSVLTNDDLLHVQTPHLSHLFVHIVASTMYVSTAQLTLVDSTLAYAGSIQADQEELAHQSSLAPDSIGAVDQAEEDEFEELSEKDWCVNEESDLGYSAETINESGQFGTILSRPRRKFEPTIPVFCTAAPLRPITFNSQGQSSSATGPTTNLVRPISSSPKSRAALMRSRIVPTFYSFLSGNAPTRIHILLNEYDQTFIKNRIIKVDSPTVTSTSTSTSTTSTPLAADSSLTNESSQSELSLSLDSWLHQRFLHQEQQLTLFAIHTCWHTLPPSLGSSFIPISRPLETYASPISNVWISTHLMATWIIIIFTTIITRQIRTSFGS